MSNNNKYVYGDRNKALRLKVKNKEIQLSVSYYYDLYPELFEDVRRRIMDDYKEALPE